MFYLINRWSIALWYSSCILYYNLNLCQPGVLTLLIWMPMLMAKIRQENKWNKRLHQGAVSIPDRLRNSLTSISRRPNSMIRFLVKWPKTYNKLETMTNSLQIFILNSYGNPLTMRTFRRRSLLQPIHN